MNLFSPDQIKIFLLILVRISVVLFLFPFFGSPVFPPVVKAGLALVLTLILFPTVPVPVELFPRNGVEALVGIVSEFLVGIALGLTVHMFIAAAQLAGELISVQMGFTLINVMDPMTGENVSIMEQLSYWIVLLVFVSLKGHHILISALADSFAVVGVGRAQYQNALLQQILTAASEIFILGIRIGAPAVAALLFTSVAFGIAAKFVPQMNILIVAFPLKIVMGLIFFGVSMQIIVLLTRGYLANLHHVLTTLLGRMAL